MATPVGQISLSDVNAELDYSPTALISMNDAAVRTLAGVGGAGTIITMQNLQGKSNRVSIPLTISSNTYNYDVYNSRGPTYDPGKSDIIVTVNPGVVVGSTSTGSYAFLVPSSFNPADTVTVVNNGVIQGMGGNGGVGGAASNSPAAGTGSTGGICMYVARPVTITNNGTIAGGGGGGGGGGGAESRTYTSPESGPITIYAGGGGGGGGAGYNGGSGAGGGYGANGPGSSGSGGTSPAGGAGGPGGSASNPAPLTVIGGTGGTGGGRGASGSAGANGFAGAGGTSPTPSPRPGAGGGSAGPYIVGLPYVTWPATGTRLGPSS